MDLAVKSHSVFLTLINLDFVLSKTGEPLSKFLENFPFLTSQK